MHWHNLLSSSSEIKSLEESLHPHVIEHRKGLHSSAFTDVAHHTIHLDGTASETSRALSYAYELKNLENSDKYQALNQAAHAHTISRKDYLTEVLYLEAEAVYFRCKIFEELFSTDPAIAPHHTAYSGIYDSIKDRPHPEVIFTFFRYIKEYGYVRHRFSAKRFYLDCYDFYAKNIDWPEAYANNSTRTKPIILPS